MAFNKIGRKLAIIAIIVVSVMIFSRPASAQTWDEFFHQDQKQHDYDMDQLIVLGVNWAKALNTLVAVGNGWETINNIAEGNFNLSRDFFGRLDGVNPDIANSAKVADIIMFQYYLTRDMNRIYNFCAAGKFTAQELRYIEKVHSNFLIMTDANISELVRIIVPGEVKMTDAERLAQIDRLYENQLDQQGFLKEFGDDVFTLSRERQKEESSLAYNRQLHTAH